MSQALSSSGQDVASQSEKHSYRTFLVLLGATLLACLLFWLKPPVSFVFDPNSEKCLPDFHLGIFVRSHDPHVTRGDLVAFKPAGALSYVKNDLVIKIVAGLPGDHLVVKKESIFINEKLVASGLPLSQEYYHKAPREFERDEYIPNGRYFLMGTHPESDDSRYWGYEPAELLAGYVKKIW